MEPAQSFGIRESLGATTALSIESFTNLRVLDKPVDSDCLQTALGSGDLEEKYSFVGCIFPPLTAPTLTRISHSLAAL